MPATPSRLTKVRIASPVKRRDVVRALLIPARRMRPSAFTSGWLDVAEEATEGRRWTLDEFGIEAETAEAARSDEDPLSFTARDYYAGRREAALAVIAALA